MRRIITLPILAAVVLTACSDESRITNPGLQPGSERLTARNIKNPNLFLASTIRLDQATGNITLPIFKGQHDGKDVWFIVTESSDQGDAAKLGVNFAPKMNNALGTAAVQDAQFVNANTGRPVPGSPTLKSQGVVLSFEGTVDFSPVRLVVPDPVDGFPPLQFRAGAVGDAEYSPMVTTGDGIVLNASHVANASGLHDAVVSIDFAKREVTLDQFNGFYEFEKILYLHQEGSIELVAAVEGSTWVPTLTQRPGSARTTRRHQLGLRFSQSSTANAA